MPIDRMSMISKSAQAIDVEDPIGCDPGKLIQILPERPSSPI